MKRICVNCGSSPGSNPLYMEMAGKLGQALIERNLELVYGGADIGLMGKVADTVLKAGGPVTGIIPKSFAQKVLHQGLTKLHIVESMHERKAMMYDLSDGFVALPGGFGTIEEFTEILTWSQLGLNKKPCGLLNVDGYFDTLLSFFDNAVTEGFIKQEHRDMLLVEKSPKTLLEKFYSYKVPSTEKWVGIKTRT
jgi:uncharacterized protein (TIGR00730 family)